jgi:hypothetical protein
MTISDLLVKALTGNQTFFKASLDDLSDADLLTRPAPSANHGNWQLGHLIVAETNLMKSCQASMPELPAGFADRYSKETASSDDASRFASKSELIALFDKTRAATIAFAKSVTPAQLDNKTGLDFAGTVGEMLLLQYSHVSMHWGQIQVLRRKLGKPILF